MAQDAQARLLIVAQVKDLVTAQMRAMGVATDAYAADVEGASASASHLAEALRLLDALGGATTAATFGMGKSLTELAGSAREANQALDAFGDYEALVAAEADGGVRSVNAFVAALEAAGAEVARIKAVGPPSFKIGAATAGTQDEQLARQFAAAKTIFGRDLGRELAQQQEWIRAQEVLDPALRKVLQDEVDLAAAIRQATIDEKANVAAFVAGEESKRAVLARFNATMRAGEDARQAGAIAQMEATAANAFTNALQRAAQAEQKFTAAIKEATAAEVTQLTRTSELAQMLRGSAWQTAIENETRLGAATRALGADYVKAAQSAQRFFDIATTRRGVAPNVAAVQAQAQFTGDLAASRSGLSSTSVVGLRTLAAEAKLGSIAMRDLIRNSRLLGPAIDSIGQVAGSTASTLIIFFVVLNRIREATTQALEFSRAMTQVATITDLTAGQVHDLGEEVQALALHFGTKELDVAKGLYLTLSSGIEDAADALKLVTAANELAVTGFASTEQTIDLLTSTINAYGLSVNDARKLNDLFFTTVRVGKAELPELAHNLGAVLPVAAQMGISLEELLAAVAALTLGGQNADESVTSLRQILSDFVNPSTDAAQVLAELQGRTTELGDSTLGAAVKSKGLLAVMKALNETVGDNSARLRELVPNQRGFVALAALSGNQLQAFERTLNATTNAAGANVVALEKVFVSQAKQIEIVQAGIRQGFLDVGQAIIDGFAPLDGTAEGARTAAEGIKAAIQGIVPVVDVAIGSMKMFAAGIQVLVSAGANVRAISAQLDDDPRKIYDWMDATEKAEIAAKNYSRALDAAVASGNAERQELLLQALSSIDTAEAFRMISDIQKNNAEQARANAAAVADLGAAYEKAKKYVAGFTTEQQDGAAFKNAAKYADDIRKALEERTVSGSYQAEVAGGPSFDKLVEQSKARAFQAAKAIRLATIQAFAGSAAGPNTAASDAAANFDALDRAAAKLEADLKKIKLVDLREEFDSTARIAAAFGSKTEKAFVTAQENVRTLTREFATFRAELDVRKSKGDFGAPTEAPAEAERAAQLAARTRLFEAQRAQAEQELATARNAIAVQKLLAQAFSGTDVSIEALTSSASVGSVALTALVEGLKAAAANAPDFAEAVRATNILKDVRENLKLTDAEQAVVELKAAMAIEDRFNVEVNAGRITGKRAEQIRTLIDELNHQAEAEVATQRAIGQRSTFATLPGVQAALGGAFLEAAAVAKLISERKTEKALKADIEFLDQRRVTTLSTEAAAIRERLSAMQESIPVWESLKLLSADDAARMRERIELIKQTTLAELERRAAIEDREQFLKGQGFGGGFTQSFEEFTRTVDSGFKQGQIVGQSFFSNLENGFASVVSGATSAKDAFKNFAQALLGDISRLLVRMLLMQTIGNSLGSLFGFGGGGGLGGIGGNSLGSQGAAGLGGGGGGGIAGVFGSSKGNVFQDRKVQAYALGGLPDIGDEPAMFRGRNGGWNSLREGGRPEAIVPLERGPNNKLGIAAYGIPQRPQINNFILPRQREVPIEFRTGSTRSRDSGSQPINVRLELNVASLDPRTAGDVVLSAMPQIERALSESIRKGSNRTLNENLRAVSGVQ